MITGSELLAQVKELQSQGITRDQILPQLGYTDPENGKLLYRRFYEALIEAKGGPLFYALRTPECTPEENAKYEELTENYGIPAVDAFVEQWSIEDIFYFEDAYVGTYASKQDFIESLLEDVAPLPIWCSIDYADSWGNLSDYYIFDEQSDAVFLRDW